MPKQKKAVITTPSLEDGGLKRPEQAPSRRQKLTIAEITPARLKKVSGKRLLNLHRRMHQLYAANFGDKA